MLSLSCLLMTGDVKNALAETTGLEPKDQRLMFRGKEKEDEEHLHMAGVKDRSKILLLEDTASKVRKLEEMRKSNQIAKASEAVAEVRAEVDKISERVNLSPQKPPLCEGYIQWRLIPSMN